VSGLISELGTLSNQQLLVVLLQHIHSQASESTRSWGSLHAVALALSPLALTRTLLLS
jgi:hypothetical protein